MSSPSVAVVILSWNGKKFLEQFIPSLLKTTYPNVKFYVADNASADDSIQYVESNFPNVKIIRIEKNQGFAKGYNVALKQVQADYFVLLNQDVEVTPGWLEPLVAFLDQDEKRAACQPKIRAFHNKEMFEYAGAAGGFLDELGYSFCRGRFFDNTEQDEGQYNSVREVVWATGACLLVKAAVYHHLGGLDAGFFAHFEEIDLCWRMKNAGYSVWCCPESVVYHVGGGSLPQGNPKKTYLNFRNNLIALAKNLPKEDVFFTILVRIALDIVTACKLLFTGKPRDFFAIMRAHFHLLRMLPDIMEKRKAVKMTVEKNRIGAPNRIGFYRGSIIWDYFIKGISRFSGLKEEKFRQ